MLPELEQEEDEDKVIFREKADDNDEDEGAPSYFRGFTVVSIQSRFDTN